VSLTVLDEFDEWPFGARRFVLAEANGAVELRREIFDIVGIENDVEDNSTGSALQLTKDEAAAIVMALGGPRDADVEAESVQEAEA